MARGNFKQKRGGGRNFSKNLVLDENGTAVSKDRPPRNRRNPDANGEEGDDSEEESEEEESEEESEEEEPAAAAGASADQPELTRAERRDLKKKKAAAQAAPAEGADDDEDPVLANPNIAVGKRLNISDLSAPRELSRREREEKEKKDAKERYWKLHAAGKTDEAKSDLARLAKIRADREAAQAKRKAEAESKSAEIEAKRKEQQAKGKRA